MKKFIFCFVLLFIAILGVHAETFKQDVRLRDHTIRVSDGVNIYDSFLSIITRSNGEPVYCLNPYKLLNVGGVYNEYNYNEFSFNLTDDTISKINLIAYYGYGYPGHTDNKWYGVTQFLIWKNLGIGDVYYTTDVGGSRTVKFENEIRELENLVNNYYKVPSISGRYLEYDLNTEYSIVDSSGLISNFEVESDLDVNISNNRLNINTSDIEGVFEIKFRKKSPVTKNYFLYNLDGAQSLIYPGKISDLEFSIFVEVSNRSIEIQKKDSEGIDRVDASLEGAIYELYNTVGRIGNLVTDKNGIAKRENLPVGDYYIKEVLPSKGYNLDTNTYHVYLNKDNKNAVIISYEEIIKGNLEIEKYFGENGIYQYEDGASFDIYDSNNNYVDTIETKDGIVNKELVYGSYIIKQNKSHEGYKKVDDFKVNIDSDKNYKYTLYNKKEEPKPEVIKQKVVSVPNTGIHDNNYIYILSALFIVSGIILIIFGKVKVTLLK